MLNLLMDRFRESERFRRLQDSTHPRIIESYCRECGALAGASPRTDLLLIAEAAHVCPRGEIKFPPQGVRPRPSR